jgi:AcrR family transcriptional regulator
VERLESDDGERAGRSGRPRDESFDDRIIAAALSELSDQGVRGFSVARVARSAGVARNSVYLRWSTADALMLDALERSARWDPVPESGSYREDLSALAAVLVEQLEAPAGRVQLRFLADVSSDDDLRARYRSRVAALGMTNGRVVFDRAERRGELKAHLDAETLFELFLGGLYTRTLFEAGNLSESPERLSSYVRHFITMTSN